MNYIKENREIKKFYLRSLLYTQNSAQCTAPLSVHSLFFYLLLFFIYLFPFYIKKMKKNVMDPRVMYIDWRKTLYFYLSSSFTQHKTCLKRTAVLILRHVPVEYRFIYNRKKLYYFFKGYFSGFICHARYLQISLRHVNELSIKSQSITVCLSLSPLASWGVTGGNTEGLHRA